MHASAAKYHVITIGGSNGAEEFEDHLIAPISVDARQIMAGEEPMAFCHLRENADRIVAALNAFALHP